MGQRELIDQQVIDETFAGLSSPSEVHAMGRPDLKTGRPGDVLVRAVSEFDAAGGFREISKARGELRQKEATEDAAVRKDSLPDLGIRIPVADAKELDLSKDSTDDE